MSVCVTPPPTVDPNAEPTVAPHPARCVRWAMLLLMQPPATRLGAAALHPSSVLYVF